MSRPARAGALAAAAFGAALAGPASAGLLGAACPGPGAAEVLLLPEDLPALDSGAPGSVAVTGAYTGADARGEDGRPKPVGVFLRAGETISLELARMDGLLIVARDGAGSIATVRDAPLGGERHDLRSLEARRRFARAAAEAGASALQSHLLIRDGELDLRVVDEAPRAARRLLMEMPDGALALWQSGLRALTLHEAAAEALREHAPRMALNLDMGTWDFCERVREGGETVSCGLLGREGIGRLSNLVRLNLSESCP